MTLVYRGSEEYYTYQLVVNRLHASGLRRHLVDKQNQENHPRMLQSMYATVLVG